MQKNEPVWQGGAKLRTPFGPHDVILIPATIIGDCFTIGAARAFLRPGATLIDSTAIVLFAFISAYATVGRFIYKYVAQRFTSYQLFEDRAVLKRMWRRREIHLDRAVIETWTSAAGRSQNVCFYDPGVPVVPNAGIVINSGMDDFVPFTPMGFYDVPTEDGLLQALAGIRDCCTDR